MTNQTGGAGIAARRLQQYQRMTGTDANVLSLSGNSDAGKGLFVGNPTDYYPSTFILYRALAKAKVAKYPPTTIVSENNSRLSEIRSALEAFTHPYAIPRWDRHALVRTSDVVHLHWIGNMIDIPSFFSHCDKPIVWTLHDMNPFLGGCHYRGDNEQCLAFAPDIEQAYRLVKQSAYRRVRRPMVICAPSRWLLDEARRSGVFPSDTSFRYVPNGLPICEKKHSRPFVRQALGLSESKPVWLFVSDNFKCRRKGFDMLMEALCALPEGAVQLVAVGNLSGDVPEKLLPYITFTGPIGDYALLMDYYYAADAFLLPSREDNLPNVMLEALSQGTPVVGMPVGGMLDVIHPMKNGLLSSDVSAKGFERQLIRLLEERIPFDRQLIQKEARDCFDIWLQAERYQQIYMDVLSAN